MSSVSRERLSAIAREVMELIDAPDIFTFLDGSGWELEPLEKRLQEVMGERQKYECIELAMYLRSSCGRSADLPSWQPLLNAAIEMCRMRGENAEALFFGLMPSQADPARNTGQPVYKPNQT